MSFFIFGRYQQKDLRQNLLKTLFSQEYILTRIIRSFKSFGYFRQTYTKLTCLKEIYAENRTNPS